MDKNYNHLKHEGEIYKRWEDSGAFSPRLSGEGESFSIIMPPPNANGELHLGHATFVAVSDALIRYHRMKGSPTLWLPGVDHAGIQTQVTFEKKLKKEQDKSRYDLGREEFVRQCYQFCMDNKHVMENQLRALGASCDWSREKFTLDPGVSDLVYSTFLKMHEEGLVYRGYRIVNWCPRCRSTLADVELEWEERNDPLYYIKYGPFTIATARPETKFRDTALAVNPKDSRYKDWMGKTLEIYGLLGNITMTVIPDPEVDPAYGTGIMKVTPAHDPHDFELGQTHNLPITPIIDFDGKMDFGWFLERRGVDPKYLRRAKAYHGKKTAETRKEVVEHLKEEGLLVKIDDKYTHSVSVCERCGTVIEPMVSRQWFIKMKPLAEKAIRAVESGEVRIKPEKYEAMYYNWMKNIKDWPISRQLWWGHQLPVWYRKEDQKTDEQMREFALLERGDTRARTDVLDNPVVAVEKPNEEGGWIRDPDTFDTWFSSGQWPVNTLRTSGEGDFERFYPTSVMNTAYEILFLWVARMIMFGIYLTGKAPFRIALMNGVLRDEKGAKMSKSKGNGVNPSEAIEKYGADAVRMALLAGRDNGNDLLISKQQMEERIRGYRNFSNKIWNVARFLEMKFEQEEAEVPAFGKKVIETLTQEDREILEKLDRLADGVTECMEKFRLGDAALGVYQFIWHELADKYIERVKTRQDKATALSVLRHVFLNSLKLLHPFAPFVTEAIWQIMERAKIKKSDELLINSSWPRSMSAATE